MTEHIEQANEKRGSRWRLAGWGMAAFLLLLPLLAMQVTSEVAWDGPDFIFFAVMLAVVGGAIELAARVSDNRSYRGGALVAIAACFLLVWVNVAVGFFRSEENGANMIFAGVIAVAVGGSIIAHFRAAGMAKAMAATAAAQALVGVVGLTAQLGSAGSAGLYEAAVGTGLFGVLWLLSAWLFRNAAASAGLRV